MFERNMGAGSKSRYILDCDAGKDDAQALMMALTRGVPMMAVTCVFGNTTVDNVTRNVLRVLNVCDRLDIPVYKGCEVSLLGEGSSLCGYHGNDGLGDVIHSHEPSEHLVKDQHAANALVSLVNKYPDEITLIATGPLTNITLALRLDPKFGTKLKQCIIMGGNTKGRGNVSMSAEFNFHTDPEAAYSVFRDLGNPITLIPLELCWKRSFSWEWYDDLVNRSTVKAQFLKACDHKMVTRNKAMGNPCHFMHDQLAVAAAIRSDVITETRHVYATVELVGTQTRGQVVLDWSLDWSGASNNKPNVHVVTKIDRELYERLIMEAVENPNATLDN